MNNVLVWIVTRENRQGWAQEGDAITWNIEKARIFKNVPEARQWLDASGLTATIFVAVN
jgi:hypothetical protein